MNRLSASAALAAMLATLPGGSFVRAHVGLPTGPVVGEVSFADPAPAGISYEWTVFLAKRQRVELVNAVGAKSWSEPSNPAGAKGWTHTSNWIAVELDGPGVLKIAVTYQQGVVNVAGAVAAVTRSALVPAVSLYEGWDETTESEVHTFNNVGNFWATVQYLGSTANPKSKPSVVYKKRLPAGRYSIVIGGNPASLGGPSAYPAADCDPLDAICYQYTGLHGYRATLSLR
jgi:hypothetical protein